MDSAFEKLGVYEFFTVFLSGVITETLFGIILHCCFHISFSLDQYILPFLLLGYFIGLLLHELSATKIQPLGSKVSMSVSLFCCSGSVVFSFVE